MADTNEDFILGNMISVADSVIHVDSQRCTIEHCKLPLALEKLGEASIANSGTESSDSGTSWQRVRRIVIPGDVRNLTPNEVSSRQLRRQSSDWTTYLYYFKFAGLGQHCGLLLSPDCLRCSYKLFQVRTSDQRT